MKLNSTLTGHLLVTQREKYDTATRDKLIVTIKRCALGPRECGSSICACNSGVKPWFRDWILQGIPIKEVIDAIDENEDVG